MGVDQKHRQKKRQQRQMQKKKKRQGKKPGDVHGAPAGISLAEQIDICMAIFEGVFDHPVAMPEVARSEMLRFPMGSERAKRLRQMAFDFHDFVFKREPFRYRVGDLLEYKSLFSEDERGDAIFSALALVCLAHDPDCVFDRMPMEMDFDALSQRWPDYADHLFDGMGCFAQLPFLLTALPHHAAKLKVKELGEIIGKIEAYLENDQLLSDKQQGKVLAIIKKVFRVKKFTRDSLLPLFEEMEKILSACGKDLQESTILRALLLSVGRFVRLHWPQNESLATCFGQLRLCAEYVLCIDGIMHETAESLLLRFGSAQEQSDTYPMYRFLTERIHEEGMSASEKFRLQLTKLRLLKDVLLHDKQACEHGLGDSCFDLYFAQFALVWKMSEEATSAVPGLAEFRDDLVSHHAETAQYFAVSADYHKFTFQVWNQAPCDFRLASLAHIAAEQTGHSLELASLSALREQVKKVDGRFFVMALMQLEKPIFRRSYYDQVYRQLSNEQKKECLHAVLQAICHVDVSEDEGAKWLLKSLNEFYLDERSLVIKSIIERKPIESRLLALGVMFHHAQRGVFPQLASDQFNALISVVSQLSASIKRGSIVGNWLAAPFFKALGAEMSRWEGLTRLKAVVSLPWREQWSRMVAEMIANVLKRQELILDFSDMSLIAQLSRLAKDADSRSLREILDPHKLVPVKSRRSRSKNSLYGEWGG